MGEYLPTKDGRPLKTTDAMLDKITELILRIRVLEIENAVLKTEANR